MATPGGNKSAVATAGTVLASVGPPLWTRNWKCTATANNASSTRPASGLQVYVQLESACTSKTASAAAEAMISSAYSRTSSRMSASFQASRSPSSRCGDEERPPGQTRTQHQVADADDVGP